MGVCCGLRLSSFSGCGDDWAEFDCLSSSTVSTDISGAGRGVDGSQEGAWSEHGGVVLKTGELGSSTPSLSSESSSLSEEEDVVPLATDMESLGLPIAGIIVSELSTILKVLSLLTPSTQVTSKDSVGCKEGGGLGGGGLGGMPF